MADYDDSSTGPAVLDLMRFAVSLLLAAETAGLEGDGDQAVDAFFEGYRAGLEDPMYDVDEPALCSDMRATFADDRGPFLEAAIGLMTPLAADDES